MNMTVCAAPVRIWQCIASAVSALRRELLFHPFIAHPIAAAFGIAPIPVASPLGVSAEYLLGLRVPLVLFLAVVTAVALVIEEPGSALHAFARGLELLVSRHGGLIT